MKRCTGKRLTVATAAALALAGCSTFNTHKGAVIDTQLAAAIQPGIDNKESVQKLLGTPSLAGQFTSTDWYYVSRDQAQLAFRDPRITRHQVLHVRFDQAGNVASVQQTDETLIAKINPSDDSTPTLGRKKGFFEELFGNIGAVGSGGLPGVGQQPPQ